MSWRGWTTFVLGVWLVIAAFIPFGGVGILVDDLIVGILIGIIGFLMIPEGSKWQGWIIGLAGIWMIISPFIPRMSAYTANLTNDLVIGIIVLLISLFERSSKKLAA